MTAGFGDSAHGAPLPSRDCRLRERLPVRPVCFCAFRAFCGQTPSMKHYDFADKFRALYDKAVKLYASGNTDKASYFTKDEQGFLAANGIGIQAMYDYAEDHNNGGEPGYDRAL